MTPETMASFRQKSTIGQLAPFGWGTYRTTCAIAHFGSHGNPAQQGVRRWPQNRKRRYRTTCAVLTGKYRTTCAEFVTGIGQLAPFGSRKYRTTCAESIGQLAPFSLDPRTTCAASTPKVSDNLRRKLGQLAPFLALHALQDTRRPGSWCCHQVVFKRFKR